MLHEKNKKTKGHLDFCFDIKHWLLSSTVNAIGGQLVFEHGN
jgi:hypothetical protein